MSEISNTIPSGKSKKRYNGRLWEINWWYLPFYSWGEAQENYNYIFGNKRNRNFNSELFYMY